MPIIGGHMIYKKLLLFLLFTQLIFTQTYLGYIRDIEASFCMDECSQYYVETENGEYIANIISTSATISLNQYVDRFVDVTVGGVVAAGTVNEALDSLKHGPQLGAQKVFQMILYVPATQFTGISICLLARLLYNVW